ncbi:hypothetical protein EDC02_7453 [Micromonospora sp. Llam0]|uniref:hypothetical protein n=1 Tax=Micromonospora sp. Llam0 TaxID=2485143 RepID=UPI000F486F60|nr:hypothetical protein [Micromonospora sp. Llam0]ROO52522.1 hypothetical protein EDC02_7453 [Micromonospora sp. Llam0]
MTADRFQEVDRELLADYVGGALDGTPDEVAVARLISERPSWRAAHDELVEATQLVQTMLAEWGSVVEPIPPDVADRVHAALAAEPLPQPAPDPTISPDLATVAAPVPLAAARVRRERRRWQRYAAPITVAAAAVAFAGLGVGQLLGAGSADDSSTTAGSAPDGADSAESQQSAETRQDDQPGTMMDASAPRLLASGTDYQRATIVPAFEAVGRSGVDGGQPAAGEDTVLQESPASTALARLADPAALADCVAAVTAEHGNGGLGVDLVDFAAFEGEPALVLSFSDSFGASWIWVSGTGCGTPVAGADTRYSAQVG